MILNIFISVGISLAMVFLILLSGLIIDYLTRKGNATTYIIIGIVCFVALVVVNYLNFFNR